MARTTRKRSKRWVAPTYGAATIVFAGALGGIAAQVKAGEDPALGAPIAEASIPQPHYVVSRRVVHKRIVVRRVRDLPPLPPKVVAVAPAAVASTGGYTPPTYVPAVSSAPAVSSSSGGSSSSAPAPAPVAAAPAPAPASVPAPVTRAS